MTHRGSTWLAVTSVVVALALVVGGLVVVHNSRDRQETDSTVALGLQAPSAFDLSVTALTSPFVGRAQPVTVQLAAPAGVKVTRIELWDDGRPYYELDDTQVVREPTTGAVRFAIDVVPMTAGAHVLLARAYDDTGAMAQSLPLALPVLDLPQDLTAASAPLPAMRFNAAPGDTLAAIADRLGVDVASLVAADGTADPTAVLPRNVLVTGTVPPVTSVKVPDAVAGLATDLTVALDGCAAVVTSTSPTDLRIYGGGGMVALGDLSPGGELRLATLPVGPTVLVAYAPHDGALPPSHPVTVTIPDTCARDAWTGNAYITGGLLLTDDPITHPYAYIAVDKGTWQRLPAADGQFLNGAATSLSDLRSLIDLSHYDQIDLEVWSGDTGAVAASGQYCRKDGAHAEPGASSASGGECTPAAAAPSGAPGTSASKPITLSLSPAAHLVPSVNISGDPTAMESWQVTGPGAATFATDAATQGYGAVMYQFSLIPFGPGSSGLNPPGVFYQVRSDVYGAASVEPWSWHGALVTDEDLANVDNLSLTDELALSMLKQHIAQGANLIDTVYVRAVAVEQVPNTSQYVSRGATSNTIELTMPTGLEGSWPQIAKGSVTVTPGRDILAITNGYAKLAAGNNPADVRGVTTTCHEVAAYPDPHAFTMYPFGAPTWRTKDGVTYQAGSPRNPADAMVAKATGPSDLSQATMLWPRDDAIYCLDMDADVKRLHDHDNDEPPSCGLGCVLSFVVYGALQGFVVGGPYGALSGALMGLAVGLGSAMDPAFYGLVMDAWDKVAGFYNQVFNVVWEVVDAVNPVCHSAKALGDSAQQFCDGTFRAVGDAVLTYYTGAPPQLATSAQLQAAEDGNLNAVIMLALDTGLKKLGLSCETFAMSGAEVNAAFTAARNVGADAPDLSSVKDAQGNLSGCAALSGVLTTSVRAALVDRQAQIMQAITGIRSVPGLVLSPVSDERPVIVVSGTPTFAPGYAQTCPMVANTEITDGGTTFRMYPVHGTAWLKYGAMGADGVRGPDAWTGELPVPPERSTAYPTKPSAAVMETLPARAGAAYLHVTVSSPCFAQDLSVDVPKYTFFGNAAAFYLDGRPIVAYH